jgi:hypothetical protein
MDWSQLLQKAVEWLLTSGLRLVLIVILTLVALRVAKFISNRVFGFSFKTTDIEFKKRVNTSPSLPTIFCSSPSSL